MDSFVPLLIGGHPKSGTTLLVSLLDSHPSLAVFPEEICIAHVLRETRPAGRAACMLNHSDIVLPGQGLVDLPNGKRDYRHIAGDDYLQDLRRLIHNAPSARDCFLAVFQSWIQHNPSIETTRIQYIAEKTPGNERLYSLYRDWFPKSRFIHIIRDPRDNYTSYLKKRGTWSVERFCDDWLRSARLALQRKGLGHYYVLRYEDLVTHPEAEMQKVASFLEIPFETTLLTPTRAGTVWGGNSMFGDNHGKVHNATHGRYRTQLPPAIIERLESYVFNELQQWEYCPDIATTGKPLPPGYRFNTWAHNMVWQIKTRFRVKLDNPLRTVNSQDNAGC